MTTAQYRPENSTRGKILYDKISPYIKDGMFILDIGCSYSPVSYYIHIDYPNCELFGFDGHGAAIRELQRKRPYYRWERILIEQGDELEDYITIPPDIVIHTGVNGSWSQIWTVHKWLFQNNYTPKSVLLETGRKDGYEQCMEMYDRVAGIYREHGFELMESGRFDFDCPNPTLRERHYSILTQQ